ncbi:VanW family protein [Anaerosporobacter faecicola]|uniref:VanW family protein n=1 Tax=Anaerosporobacter faecicola TaxID=2718714 RepID=UPI00143896FF|nr:VanW family protein [Anaerosporobacter faecicola]
MNKKKVALIVAGVMLVLTIIVAGAYVTISASIDDDTICKGIFIDSVDVGGMTVEQAQEAVDAYITDRAKKEITIQVDEDTVTGTLEELGYQVSDNEIIDEAMKIGKSGNIIKRYKETKDVEKENKVFNLEFTLDQNAVQELVEKECTKYDIPAENATMKRENGEFVFEEHVIGRKIDVDATVQAVSDAVMNDWNGENLTINASVEEDIPEYTSDELRECTDVLGTATTNFADSKAARVNNVTVATNFINGTVVYPGETFSVYEAISPITIANGYEKAGAYENGVVVESEGGGVCQVSSTLYNTVLKSELEVVERSPHSMVVSYVPRSADAAIAGTYKDLKFKNSTESPIYIEGYIVGRNVTFTIYGNETRPSNRTIEFVSETISTTQPPADVITEDKTLPSSYKKVTSPAHTGYRARLWKVVYIDGKETERIQVNSSTYTASPRYITVGKQEEEKEEEDKDKEEDKNKEEDKVTDKDKDDNKDKDQDKDKTEESKPSKDETSEDNSDDTEEDTNPDTEESTGEGEE